MKKEYEDEDFITAAKELGCIDIRDKKNYKKKCDCKKTSIYVTYGIYDLTKGNKVYCGECGGYLSRYKTKKMIEEKKELESMFAELGIPTVSSGIFEETKPNRVFCVYIEIKEKIIKLFKKLMATTKTKQSSSH